jgi:hypothetical protein
MESEKLSEGKKTFTEDQEKYYKFRQELRQRVDETDDQVRVISREIEKLLVKQTDLRKKQQELA